MIEMECDAYKWRRSGENLRGRDEKPVKWGYNGTEIKRNE
jgi:hypothetical protein